VAQARQMGRVFFRWGNFPTDASLSLFSPHLFYIFFPGKIHLEQESGILFDLPSRPFPTRKKKKELFKFFTILYMCVLSDPHRQKKKPSFYFTKGQKIGTSPLFSLSVWMNLFQKKMTSRSPFLFCFSTETINN
jgi:hypothetical protein